jgi:hypothetical protein
MNHARGEGEALSSVSYFARRTHCCAAHVNPRAGALNSKLGSPKHPAANQSATAGTSQRSRALRYWILWNGNEIMSLSARSAVYRGKRLAVAVVPTKGCIAGARQFARRFIAQHPAKLAGRRWISDNLKNPAGVDRRRPASSV